MNIYMWGTGRLAGEVLDFEIDPEKITGFIDNDISKAEYIGKKVYSPAQICGMPYDAIIVSTIFVKEIMEQCKELNIELNKVIFLQNNCVLEDVNKNYEFVEKVLGEHYAKKIQSQYYVIRGIGGDSYHSVIGHKEHIFNNDYIRMKTFQLAVEEIEHNSVQGEVAEFGVFRGEFAQYINAAFPEKKCYLFDTFEGFEEKETKREIEKGNCTEAIADVYKKTDIQIVMNRMPYKEKVIIKQGFFPESLDGLEERFAFVSIDADYEESIFNGLVYFYPRLNEGGYIFVHDYNTFFKGVKEAVYAYEKKMGITLCKIPLCDKHGSLIITK